MTVIETKKPRLLFQSKLPTERISFPGFVAAAEVMAAAVPEAAGWAVGKPCLVPEVGIRSLWSTALELRGPSSRSSSEPECMARRTSRPASRSSALSPRGKRPVRKLIWTHQNIFPDLSFDAEAVSHLFALESDQEPRHAKVHSEREEAAMLVKGLQLRGVIARVDIETLRGAAVE